MNKAATVKYLKNDVQVITSDSIFYFCCWMYLIALTILPDWFGFYLGMLFSAKRIMLIICYCFIIFGRRRLNVFLKDLKTYKWANIIIALYMLVRLYTAVLRIDLQSFMGEFLNGVLVFYFIAYILKHEISYQKLFKFLRIVLWLLIIEGIFEYLTGINIFSFLDTTNQFSTVTGIRDGALRIQANCHHAIHYGIYISILFFLSCYDFNKNKLYLFRNPLLLLLSLIVIYFSGSRAPLGIFLLCCFLICFFSGKDNLIKSLIILLSVLSVLVLFLLLMFNTPVGQTILQSLAMICDEVFGTTFVADFFDAELAASYAQSAEYREILYSIIFQLDYLNIFLGRGVSYNFGIYIEGYTIRSVDNFYIMNYIQFAYPGLIIFILFIVFILGTVLYGMLKTRNTNKLFATLLIVLVCYYINIWFVAEMGTFMYIWMVFAIAYVANQNIKINNKELKNAVRKN